MVEITFKSLYEEEKKKPTAAQFFISEVASLTKRSESTVRMWIAGTQTPDELVKSVIAQRYNVDINSLFPNS